MSDFSSANCIGFIMDGNRRFAKERGMSTAWGHWQGKEKLLATTDWLKEAGFKHAVFYTFSSENWQRSEAEVQALLDLLTVGLDDFREKIKDGAEVNLKIIGDLKRLPDALQTKIKQVESLNKAEHSLTLWLLISYGGRSEIVKAVNQVVEKGARVTEESFRKELWSADLPELDLLVRTGGEKRLSNFLPWQTAYSELFFIDTYWPAFSQEEFLEIMAEYKKREKRFGR